MGTSKSKRKSRSRSRQKRLRGSGTPEQRIRDRLGAEGVAVAKSAGGVKMSEVLEAFVQPYLELATTEESLRKLMAIAVVAWNASLLPKERRAEMVDQVLGGLPSEARGDGKHIVRELIRRRERHFAEFRRAVIDFEVRDTREGFRLVVASTPEDV